MIVASVIASCFALLPGQSVIYSEEDVGERVVLEMRGDQARPYTAAAGDVALAVYSDLETASVHGVILDERGAAEDETSFRIARNAAAAGVATDGNIFLVLWTPVEGPRAIYGARVRRNGSVVDQESFLIAGDGATDPSVTFDGADYVVSYTDDWDIRVVRVTPEGLVIEPSRAEIPCPSLCGRSSIAVGPGGYLLAWSNPSDVGVEGTRLDLAFNPLDQPPIPISGWDGAPQLVFGTSAYLVAFEGPSSILGALVGIDGSTLARDLELDGPGTTPRAPAVAAASSGALRVAYARTGVVEVASVLASGTSTAVHVLADPVRRVHDLDLAVFDSRAFAVWDEDYDEIRVQREDWSSSVYVSLTANAQTMPAVASSRNQSLTAWLDDGALRARVSNRELELPSTPGSRVLRVRALDAQNQFYVFWFEDGESVRYVRISHGGALLDAAPIETRGAHPFDVATDGTDVAMLYPYAGVVHLDFIDPRAGLAPQELGAIDRDGVDQDVALTRGPDTWAGIWVSCEENALCAHEAVVLDAYGMPLRDPVPVGRMLSAGVAVAFNGVTYTAVYGNGSRLVSRELEPLDGNFIPGTEVEFCGERCFGPRAIFDGYRAIVAWVEEHEDGVHTFMETFPERLVAPKMDISALETSEPALAMFDPGRVWIAYRRFVREAPYDTDRVFRRELAFGPRPSSDAGISPDVRLPDGNGGSDRDAGGEQGMRDAGISGSSGLEEAEGGCGCSAAPRSGSTAVSVFAVVLAGLIRARRRWHAARAP